MLFATEYQLIENLSQLIDQSSKNTEIDMDVLTLTQKKLIEFLKQDAKFFASGTYILELLEGENFVKHFSRLPVLAIDQLRAKFQKKKKITKWFTPLTKLDERLPDYYKRNFHFQLGGYLNQYSAYLYDHQVELLFSGSAKAMRRTIIKEIKDLPINSSRPLKILEVGCGSGELTYLLSKSFPKSSIIAMDLSKAYLSKAKRQNKSKNVDFIQGNAEKINLKDQTFDLIVSSFLFHELPKSARINVLSEANRLLKTDGHIIFLDSLQKDDDPELNALLDYFPVHFHEPFYKEYSQTPMRELFENVGLVNYRQNLQFLSKTMIATPKV